MMILDWLDQLEREGTTGIWTSDKTVAVSRNHLRALIDVARAAASFSKQDQCAERFLGALAPLLVEEGGER